MSQVSQLPDHIDGLLQYLRTPEERSNEDLALKFFRHIYGEQFTRQREADRADGYVPGHFVLELKSRTNEWYAGFFQGLAYKRNLNFSLVVVATKSFLAIWRVQDVQEKILKEVVESEGAPNELGRRFARKFASLRGSILNSAIYRFPSETLEFPASLETNKILSKEIKRFEQTISGGEIVRQKITIDNFHLALKQMKDFFDPSVPMKAVRAFYSMLFGWSENSVLEISQKFADQATLCGEMIEGLLPGKRLKFKEFVESHYIALKDGQNVDDFFAKYDTALDAVDRSFRKKNGIFFTDLDLSKFTMWFVRKNLGDIGKNHLVIDPACGSGNLVTNWRSPMELRHKVVSEIEPELLYTVEQRMKGDKWHNGKFTVIPKVSEGLGLNFLDKSAEEYLKILKAYLSEKNILADKPIAFLCNPPYRSDDDQSADSVKYDIHESILSVVGQDGSAERSSCFLAQMKRIAEVAESSGLPGDSLLLLFTGTSWLTQRSIYEKIRSEIFGSFEDVGALMVASNEFFDVPGKFPIAFTIWRYQNGNAVKDPKRPIEVLDLTHLKQADLATIDWADSTEVNRRCGEIVSSAKTVKLGVDREVVGGQWLGFGRKNLYRNLTKAEKAQPTLVKMGLPTGDPRHLKKTIYGHANGSAIGFLLDLTPCRISGVDDFKGKPWFHLDSRFMRVNTNRIFSGMPDSRGYCATDEATTNKLFIWFSFARTFMSFGYPLWANADEIWRPDERKIDPDVLQLCAAICYGENECVEVFFPSNNPINGAAEAGVSNPFSPLDRDSFWLKSCGRFRERLVAGEAKDLIDAVDAVYRTWEGEFKNAKEIFVDYDKNYFVGEKKLTKYAGLPQIRDYAQETEHTALLTAFEGLTGALNNAKKRVHERITSKKHLDFFASDYAVKAPVPALVPEADPAQKRLYLAAKIVNELIKSKQFGRVKFAKAFYLSDMISEEDLETVYYREAAGPLDHVALYSDDMGVESLASKQGFFTATKRQGTKFDYVVYKTGNNIKRACGEYENLFGKKKEIESLLKLVKPMSVDQIEIVATLYACWNDLILSKKPFSDAMIISEFKNSWHPEKTKKFLSPVKGDKARFSVEQLAAALAWMRQNHLTPAGKNERTRIKRARTTKIPF